MNSSGKSRFAILGMLAARPMSGYDIKKETEASTRHFWNESFGNLYATLGKLEREGLVTVRVVHQTGKPDRKVYSLTADGRKVLRDWLREPAEPQPPRNEPLLKLFFGSEAPPDVSLAHVRRLRRSAELRLEAYDKIQSRLAERPPDEPALPFWLMTLDYGRRVSNAVLEWCDESLEVLGQRSDPETPEGHIR